MNIVNYLNDVRTNFWLALGLYWFPLMLCLIFNTIRIVGMYKLDLNKRNRYLLRTLENSGFNTYYPTLTVGHVVGYFLLSTVPVVNAFAAYGKYIWHIMDDLLCFFTELLSQPIVPRKK